MGCGGDKAIPSLLWVGPLAETLGQTQISFALSQLKGLKFKRLPPSPLPPPWKRNRSMMIGKLVALIEEHADELTLRMVRQVRENPRTEGYRRFGEEELGDRARLVYSNLGQWLSQTSEVHVEEEYYRLGKLRHEEGVPLSEVVMALLLTRRNLWQFVESQGWDSVFDLRQQLDLELLVVRFFDRAIHHAVRGYEDAAWGRGG